MVMELSGLRERFNEQDDLDEWDGAEQPVSTAACKPKARPSNQAYGNRF